MWFYHLRKLSRTVFFSCSDFEASQRWSNRNKIQMSFLFCFASVFFKCTNCIPFHNSKSNGCSSNRCIVDELWVRYNVYVQWILSTLCRCEMICNEWLNTYSIICHLFCSSEMNRGYRRLLAPLPLAISSWYL